MSQAKKLLFATITISLLFFVAIGFDLSPLLRGPAPHPIEWQWPYLFVNTLNKILPSIILIFTILYLFNFFDKLKTGKLEKYEKVFLPLVVILSFLFELSVIYFSRAGLFVLLQRTIMPGANGYFATAVSINSFSNFLTNFNSIVSTLPMHAEVHTPGVEILYFFINCFFNLFPLVNKVPSLFSPSSVSVFSVWTTLMPYQKSGALFISLFIPFVASFITVPLYYLFKLQDNAKNALRGIFLYIFVPSITLFLPLPDVLFSLFPILGFLFLILVNKKNNVMFIFLSGLTLSVGFFFSLSLLPFILMFLIVILFQHLRHKEKIIRFVHKLGYFFVGLILPYVFLYAFYGFNIIQVSNTILGLTVTAYRSYAVWLFYNLYDFFIFAGIPILICFIYAMKKNFKKIKDNYLFLSFFLTLLILNISGNVRGETARLWIPFIPFLILITVSFLTKEYKLKTKDFLIILLVQAVQVLVMQEFWVSLW
jgi:methylthioxylose transferase